MFAASYSAAFAESAGSMGLLGSVSAADRPPDRKSIVIRAMVFERCKLRIPLKIHFGSRANLFVAGQRQTKATLSTDKADLSSLPANKNLLLAAQKQLLELPLRFFT